jgi:fucose permease
MNLTHFCFGLGSAGAQRVSGKLLQGGMDFRYVYLFGAALFFIIFILFIFLKVPLCKPISSNKINNKIIFKNNLIYMYILALGFYVFCEIGTSNWFVNLMENSYGFSKNKSAIYLSLFFAIFTIGRLLGGFVVERFGYLKSITYAIFIAFILYTSGLVLKDQGVLLISISGLFLSITFPTMIISVSKAFKELGAYATGIVVTGASSINMFLNMVVGYFNEYMKNAFHSEVKGIYYAYYILPVCILITLVFCSILYFKDKKGITNNSYSETNC